MEPDIRTLAEKLWNYHQMKHQLAPADAILVLCSHEIPEDVWRAYEELVQAGYDKYLIRATDTHGQTRTSPKEVNFQEINFQEINFQEFNFQEFNFSFFQVCGCPWLSVA